MIRFPSLLAISSPGMYSKPSTPNNKQPLFSGWGTSPIEEIDCEASLPVDKVELSSKLKAVARQQIEEEIKKLKRRLAELQERSRQLQHEEFIDILKKLAARNSPEQTASTSQ
jgi:hypothetical protein